MLIASIASILSNICVVIYGIYNPDYVPERWHAFIGYILKHGRIAV
jgi:choline transport protein